MNAADQHLRYLRERQADVTRRLVHEAREALRTEGIDGSSDRSRPHLRLVGGIDVLEPTDGTLAG
jgi:hypothetical protein